MKLDMILKKMLPKDDKFYMLFQEDVDNVLNACRIFNQAMSRELSKEERHQKIRKLEEVEHRGDEITHRIFETLATSFITPFDREDIHSLASKLDDIVDYLQVSANQIILYKIKSVSVEQEKLAQIIFKQAEQLHQAIRLLQTLKNAASIKDCLVVINSLENEADDIFERAIADLFENCEDPILLIKMKGLLENMEMATDKCEDAANVIESILIKNV